MDYVLENFVAISLVLCFEFDDYFAEAGREQWGRGRGRAWTKFGWGQRLGPAPAEPNSVTIESELCRTENIFYKIFI